MLNKSCSIHYKKSLNYFKTYKNYNKEGHISMTCLDGSWEFNTGLGNYITIFKKSF